MYQEKKEIESFGFNVVSNDFERPWGGFFSFSLCLIIDPCLLKYISEGV